MGGVAGADRLLRRPLGRLAGFQVLLGPLASGLRAALASDHGRATEIVTGAIGVFLLGAVVYTGLEGTDEPNLNFAVTFVFVTFWLGMVVLSILLGDVFRAFNPWRAIARTAGAVFRLIAGQPHSAPLRYPERLGRWPAAAGIVGFVWLELVYATSGLGAVGLQPDDGRGCDARLHRLHAASRWPCSGSRPGSARRGLLGLLRDVLPARSAGGPRRAAGVRRPLAAATRWAAVPGSLALVVATIAATTFDGAQEGLWQQPIRDLFDRLTDLGLGPTAAFRTSESIFFALTLAGVAAIYWAGVRGMRTVRGSPALRSLGRSFAHTLIPIGVAYLAAHYFSLFVFAEQAQFTYLLSDPLGDGSDLFGTASGGIDYGLLGANTIWYVQVAALVTGHVVAPDARPRPRDHRLRRPRSRLAVAAVDAAGHGRLHLPGPVPALAGQRLMLLPLAHVAHWYFWPLYALPVLIVLWSVIATTAPRAPRRAGRGKKGAASASAAPRLGGEWDWPRGRGRGTRRGSRGSRPASSPPRSSCSP